jgi:tRNA threonylcarbamoyladenosine biosynthesis protein TsaE
MKTVLSNSDRETQNLGQTFAKSVGERAVLALFGHLGSGKTQFTKGLARGLGIAKTITSPTFTILKSYIQKKSGKTSFLKHFDFYRLGSKAQLASTGFFEALDENRGVIVIEWPEKVAAWLPRDCFKLYFTYGKKENQRKIRIAGKASFPSAKTARKK